MRSILAARHVGLRRIPAYNRHFSYYRHMPASADVVFSAYEAHNVCFNADRFANAVRRPGFEGSTKVVKIARALNVPSSVPSNIDAIFGDFGLSQDLVDCTDRRLFLP